MDMLKHTTNSFPLRVRLFFTTVFILVCFLSKGQDKIETDRPDQTEIATLVPLHYFQGEFGFRYENAIEDNYTVNHPAALLKYGLFNKLELRFEATFKTEYLRFIPQTKTTTGFEPLEVGFKAALFNEKGILPKTSLITHVAIPTLASAEFKARHVAPAFVFVMKNTLSEKMDLGYNLGVEWDGFNTTPYYIYSLSLGFALGEKWSAYVEPFGFVYSNQPPETVFDGGLQYYVSNDFKVDASAGIGLSENAPDYYIDIGFSFRFK